MNNARAHRRVGRRGSATDCPHVKNKAMQIRVVILRYNEVLQNSPDDALHTVTFGRKVLNVKEHCSVHGNSHSRISPIVTASALSLPCQNRQSSILMHMYLAAAERPMHNLCRAVARITGAQETF